MTEIEMILLFSLLLDLTMHLPESPPINGLFSKCSTNSLKHEKVPMPNLYCEPSQPIWKCFTELAHLIETNQKQNFQMQHLGFMHMLSFQFVFGLKFF